MKIVFLNDIIYFGYGFSGNADGEYFVSKHKNIAKDYLINQKGFVSLLLFRRFSNPICMYLPSNSWGNATDYRVRVMLWFRMGFSHLKGSSNLFVDFVDTTFREI